MYIVRPSLIPAAGLGVFTLKTLEESEKLLEHPVCNRLLEFHQIPQLFLKHCVLLQDGRRFLCPPDFNTMGPLWFMNHARIPNVQFNGGRLVASRTIHPGEELTLYYSDLLTHPCNQWVNRKEHV